MAGGSGSGDGTTRIGSTEAAAVNRGTGGVSNGRAGEGGSGGGATGWAGAGRLCGGGMTTFFTRGAVAIGRGTKAGRGATGLAATVVAAVWSAQGSLGAAGLGGGAAAVASSPPRR